MIGRKDKENENSFKNEKKNKMTFFSINVSVKGHKILYNQHWAF